MTGRGLQAICVLTTGLLAASSVGPAQAARTGRAASTSLISVAATGPDNAWAVGYLQSGAWSGVAATGANDAWAVSGVSGRAIGWTALSFSAP